MHYPSPRLLLFWYGKNTHRLLPGRRNVAQRNETLRHHQHCISSSFYAVPAAPVHQFLRKEYLLPTHYHELF